MVLHFDLGVVRYERGGLIGGVREQVEVGLGLGQLRVSYGQLLHRLAIVGHRATVGRRRILVLDWLTRWSLSLGTRQLSVTHVNQLREITYI